MTVTGVGLLAGNSGLVPPAFEERVDWFRFIPPDRTPPVLGGSVTATPGAGSTVKVAWSTDEPATSEVVFGATTAYESGTIATSAEVHAATA